MKIPKINLFDYGQTLVAEEKNSELAKLTEEIFECAEVNKYV